MKKIYVRSLTNKEPTKDITEDDIKYKIPLSTKKVRRKIFIDKKSSLFLIGTEMDYEKGELESGFKFINPNEKGRCGCGESFHV